MLRISDLIKRILDTNILEDIPTGIDRATKLTRARVKVKYHKLSHTSKYTIIAVIDSFPSVIVSVLYRPTFSATQDSY